MMKDAKRSERRRINDALQTRDYIFRAAHRFSCIAKATLVLTIAATLVGCASTPPDASRASLFAAERAFAQQARERGIRTAFVANFAPDGIAFEPGPVRYHDAVRARPAPADPLAYLLEWAPATGAVSASGDLGFTTGPSVLTSRRDDRLPHHGVFLSVWKRDASGTWHVALDAGTDMPRAIRFDELESEMRLYPAPGNDEDGARTLIALESRVAGFSSEAYAELLAKDAIVLEDDAPPARGARAGVLVARSCPRCTFAPDAGYAAAANDLAYTYGSYRSTPGTAPTGYYVHIWTRDPSGRWQIAVAAHLSS
jgi:ketosteroid isomerase-like protein